jgi:hypothetical protein
MIHVIEFFFARLLWNIDLSVVVNFNRYMLTLPINFPLPNLQGVERGNCLTVYPLARFWVVENHDGSFSVAVFRDGGITPAAAANEATDRCVAALPKPPCSHDHRVGLNNDRNTVAR